MSLSKVAILDLAMFVCLSGGRTGALVAMNHCSVENSGDESPLLLEAAEAAASTPVFCRMQAVPETDYGFFFLSRYTSAGIIYIVIWWSCSAMPQKKVCPFSLLCRSKNLAFSIVLLFGCYSAVLIPAYLHLDTMASLNDDYQQPKDSVWTHILATTLGNVFTLTKYISTYLPLIRSYKIDQPPCCQAPVSPTGA